MRERKRNRMINFDYSSDNLYFVTSCTKDRNCCFGEIINGNMVLNEMGEIAPLPHESFRVGCFKKNKPKTDKIKNNEQKL